MKYRLMVDIPFLKKGREFFMDEETARVYGYESDGEIMAHPLRTGLASYLWLLRTEPKYMKKVRVRR